MVNPLAAEEEIDLIRRAQRGDRGAMNRLLETHQQRVYRVCIRMVGHREDAAELAQDTLVKLVENLETFRGDAKLTTWLTRVAINACLSHRRKAKLRQTVSIDQPAVAAAADGPTLAHRLPEDSQSSAEPRPEQRVQLKEDLARLQQALLELDPEHRSVLVLRDIEQLDYQAIGEVLDLPLGTVKSRLFRAREALRQTMHAAESQPGRPAD